MANYTEKDGKFQFKLDHGIISRFHGGEYDLIAVGGAHYPEIARICDPNIYESVKTMSGEDIDKMIHAVKARLHVCNSCGSPNCSGCNKIEYLEGLIKDAYDRKWLNPISLNGEVCDGGFVFDINNLEDENGSIAVYGVGNVNTFEYLMVCRVAIEILASTMEDDESEEEFFLFLDRILGDFNSALNENEFMYFYNVAGVGEYRERFEDYMHRMNSKDTDEETDEEIGDTEEVKPRLSKKASKKSVLSMWEDMFVNGICATSVKTEAELAYLREFAYKRGIIFNKALTDKMCMFYDFLYVKNNKIHGSMSLERSGCDGVLDIKHLILN